MKEQLLPLTFSVRIRRPLLALVAFLILGCTAYKAPPEPAVETSLEIKATIIDQPQEESARPRSKWVRATLRNIGKGPVAICRCFGIRNTWLFFDIRYADTKGVADAGPEYDLFSRPPYKCLQPGESITIQKDLFYWHAEFGDLVLRDWGPDAYRLKAGYYLLRVGYYDDGQRRLRRCPTPAGEVFSQWIDLHLSETSPLGKQIP